MRDQQFVPHVPQQQMMHHQGSTQSTAPVQQTSAPNQQPNKPPNNGNPSSNDQAVNAMTNQMKGLNFRRLGALDQTIINEVGPSLYVRCRLNGELIDCLVDTGADMTVISLELANKLRLEVKETTIRAGTATKEPAGLMGVAEVHIETADLTVTVNALVLRVLSDACLLGLDVLRLIPRFEEFLKKLEKQSIGNEEDEPMEVDKVDWTQMQPNVTQSQAEKLPNITIDEFLDRNRDIFASNTSELKGTDLLEHEINTKDRLDWRPMRVSMD